MRRLRKRQKKAGEGPPWASTPPGFSTHCERAAGVSPRRAKKTGRRLLAAAVCLLALVAWPLLGKEKKVPRVVTGAVLDAADNGIAGASVELTDLQTGKKVAIFTQEGGRYLFSDIKATHDYEVQANYHGVSSDVRKASSFDTRNRIILDLRIPPPKP